MKKLFSALFAVVFALTVSGFALAADNAAMPAKAEKKVEEKKVEKKPAAKKAKKKAVKKDEVKKDEMKKDNTAPAPVKK
jgi:pentapeptide MXKDX repeat protein